MASTKEQAPAAERDLKRPRNRNRVMWRWIKRGIAAMVVLAFVGLVIKASLPKPVAVDMAVASSGPMQVTVDEDGQARVKDRYVISSPLNGRLARIELHPGDTVKQGQVLARIVPLASPLLDERSRDTAQSRVAASLAARRQTGAQIERAKATLEYAEAETKRIRELVSAGALPRRDLDNILLQQRTASADLDSMRFGSRIAAHELQMARAALGHLDHKGGDDGQQLEVPSPVNGRVLKVLQRSEGVVQAGTPLIEVGDPQALEIVADVLTSDAVTISAGAKAMVDRWGGEPLAAQVRMVEPSAFSRLSALGVEEQRVNVLLDLNPPVAGWAALGDGYRVEVHVVVWQGDEVLQVPASSVFRQEGNWSVYRVEGNLARLQRVALGKRNGAEVQIVEGLNAGVQVVLHPSDQIRDGIELVAR